MSQVYQSAFLKALGWSLIDSLWQMGLLWLLYVLLTANGKRYQSHQRHTIALLSLAGGSLWFMISLVINFYEAAAAPAILNWNANNAAPVIEYGFFGTLNKWIEPALPFLSMGYLLAAAWLFVRFFYRYRYTKQLLKAETIKVAPELRVFLQQAAARMGIKKKVVLWLSAAAEAPMTLGFWKPVILLPISIVNHLSMQQTEAILLHELKHIKRNDYLINILMACVDVVLFFNPFAQWLSSAIRRERENSCDDLVLQFRYDPTQYATSLLVLEQQRAAARSHFAVAATGSKTPVLLHRVKRILHQEQVCAPVSQRMIAYLLTAALFGFVAFYNPGNVIVKKIYPVVFNTEARPRYEYAGYTQPEQEKEAPKAAPKKQHSASKTTTNITFTGEVSFAIPYITALTANDAEQILRLATGIQLASMVENHLARVQELEMQVENVCASTEKKDFTFLSQRPILCGLPEASAEIKPYVPRTSFAYQYMEDSTSPKIYIATQLQTEAKLAINRALSALEEVNWTKLEQELTEKGIALSASQIRQELHRAFMEITWKRISEGSITPADNAREIYAKARADWQKELENYQRKRAKKTAEQANLRKQIVEERIMENMKEEQRKAMKNKTVIDI